VSGTTLTFTTAPPNTSPIEVITLGPAITTSTPNTLQNGTSSVSVLQNGNVTISSAGTSNVVVVSNTGATVTNASITGNLTVSGNIITPSGQVVNTLGKSIAMSIVFGGI